MDLEERITKCNEVIEQFLLILLIIFRWDIPAGYQVELANSSLGESPNPSSRNWTFLRLISSWVDRTHNSSELRSIEKVVRWARQSPLCEALCMLLWRLSQDYADLTPFQTDRSRCAIFENPLSYSLKQSHCRTELPNGIFLSKSKGSYYWWAETCWRSALRPIKAIKNW